MARRSRARSSSGWPYLVVGLSIGLAVAAGVYFSDFRSGAGVPKSSRAASNAARPASQASTAGAQRAAASTRDASKTGSAETAASSRPDAPSYEFYDVLPRYEVVVPNGRSEERSARRESTQPAPVGEPGRYIVQAGSFRSHADADRRQASLALLGIESRIETAALGDGEVHRVRIGPISDLGELNRIRSLLGQAGIESLMMKAE